MARAAIITGALRGLRTTSVTDEASPAYQAASEHRFKGADYRAISLTSHPNSRGFAKDNRLR